MRGKTAFGGILTAAFVAALVSAPLSASEVVSSATFGYHWVLPEDVVGFEVTASTTGSAVKC